MSKRHPGRHALRPRPAWLRRLAAKYDAPMRERRIARRRRHALMLLVLFALSALAIATA